MQTLTFEQKYQAIGTQTRDFEGRFITAVKTTGIFCRPSCRARKPKAENVEFYDTVEQALQYGYRPCKVCKPMEQLDETPDYIKALVADLQQDPFLKLKDWDLKQRGIEPATLRRWFQKHHNMTFHAFVRMMRINNAYKTIKAGTKITEAAMESGFNSLSGFNEGYKGIFGDAPSKKHKQVINIVRFSTVIGPMFACSTEKGICLLEFTDRRMLETEFKDLCKRFNAVILPGSNSHLKQVEVELKEYLAGEREQFNVALDAAGTEFQQQVWQQLQTIEYGKTRSYKEQAQAIGKPSAVRAVANANGMNKIAIIIPCHRVIGADGSLTGYGGGLHRKEWLLNLESAN